MVDNPLGRVLVLSSACSETWESILMERELIHKFKQEYGKKTKGGEIYSTDSRKFSEPFFSRTDFIREAAKAT